MRLYKQIAPHVDGAEFVESFYYQDSNFSAATSVDRKTIQSPDFLALDIGGGAYQKTSSQQFSLDADASWDFGQSIGTWQAGHSYNVNDWVRPVPVTAPTDLSGCALWLDASQGVTQVDGKASQWNDMSGNGNHATQSNETYMPTYVASAQGGRPTVRFDGSNDYLLLPNIDKTNYTVFFAMTPGSATGYRSLLARSNPSVAPYILNGQLYTYGSGSGNLSGMSIYLTSVIGTFRFGSGLSEAWSNGGYYASNTSISSSGYFTGISTTGYGQDYQGDISEIIIFNRALTDIERSWIEQYLSNKYSISLASEFGVNYKCTSSGTSLSSEPTWGTSVGGTTAESGGPTWTCYLDDTINYNRAGSDFYVYACQTNTATPLLLLSRNSTYPHGYTASNSRKIAGFHCLCNSVGTISGHTLTGYLTGDILPASVWDYNWRSASGSNVGLTYSSKLQKWVGIYLMSGTVSAPVIAYNGTILDTITWFQACDAGKALKMKLPKDYEFQVFAAGSPEATNIYGSADPVTAGGYIDTASVRMISNIGCEGCAGQMYQWLDETSYRFDAATAHTHNVTVSALATPTATGTASADVAPAVSWKAQTGGKGSLYTQGTYGVVKTVGGGDWDDTTNAGTRSRDLQNYPWNVTVFNISFRLITDHIERGA